VEDQFPKVGHDFAQTNAWPITNVRKSVCVTVIATNINVPNADTSCAWDDTGSEALRR